jgi:ADP-ribose pyrophosphatase YjhB (NUDIX family)
LTSELSQAVRVLGSVVDVPSQGLPEDVFLLLSRMTPLVNVDLVIHDPTRKMLLTWRDDQFDGPGWHVPGGIIRFKETAANRIKEVARLELGAEIAFEPTPIAVQEHMHPNRRSRGHFISLLYRCTLLTEPDPDRQYVSGKPFAGQWQWHAAWPQNIVEVQRHYAEFF